MKSKSALCAIALLLCTLPARAHNGEQEGRTQLVVPMKNGAFVSFTTETVPSSAEELSFGFMEAEARPNLIHRYFVDREHEYFFGYELLVEPSGARGQFRVSVRALSAEFQEQLRARKAFQTRRLHPGYSAAAFPAAPQLASDGDTIALDVLYNPRTGTKIVDLINISLADPRLKGAPVSAQAPRDFTPSDVQLKVTNYSLLVNGESVWKSTSGCAGALVWFSLGDRGRFVFSLVPRPGYDFRKVGQVEHNKISFEWGGDRYEWVSSQPVVGGGGNWNLWVLHDADYSAAVFDTTPPPGQTAPKQTFEQTLRRARDPKTRAEFDTPDDPGRPAPKKRLRVAIGAAPEAESILHRKTELPPPPGLLKQP